jgi:hypothetical protein
MRHQDMPCPLPKTPSPTRVGLKILASMRTKGINSLDCTKREIDRNKETIREQVKVDQTPCQMMTGSSYRIHPNPNRTQPQPPMEKINKQKKPSGASTI